MLFNSPIFLFLFLPFVLTFYFLIPKPLKNLYLLCASLLFYFWGQKSYVFIMILSIVFNYFFALLIGKKWKKEFKNLKLIFLILGIQFNLALLIFYKYTWFLLRYINPLLHAINSGNIQVENIILVAGISFYTFHGISYLVDVYRGQKPQRNIINTALYISLFPQLLAGPIVRYHTIAKEIIERKTIAEDVSYGIQRFIIGLSKKVLIADKISPVVDLIFATSPSHIPIGTAWLGLICYGLQIYFDFSGYSDMAIGLGRILGFHFLENFNYPYVSQSITEFWRRWHISLSSWFRDYVYIPLGGNKKGNTRTYMNLLTVFFFAGLWHGANWNFIIWGLWYGIFLVLERWKIQGILNNLWKPIRQLYTLFVILVGWVFFRSSDIYYVFGYFKSLFLGVGKAPAMSQAFILHNDILFAISVGLVISFPVKDLLISLMNKNYFGIYLKKAFFVKNIIFATYLLFLFILFFLVTIQLSVTTYHPFIYYQF